MAAWIVSVSVAVLCGSFFSQIVGSASVEYFSSSTWNKEDASKANDDNNVTCSVTGFGASPWWKVDLGEAKLVEKVKLYGDTIAGLIIRVGDDSAVNQNKAGHFRNRICVAWRDEVILDGVTFPCKQPLLGRYVSVEPFQKDGTPAQLTLCVVAISTQ